MGPLFVSPTRLGFPVPSPSKRRSTPLAAMSPPAPQRRTQHRMPYKAHHKPQRGDPLPTLAASTAPFLRVASGRGGWRAPARPHADTSSDSDDAGAASDASQYDPPVSPALEGLFPVDLSTIGPRLPRRSSVGAVPRPPRRYSDALRPAEPVSPRLRRRSVPRRRATSASDGNSVIQGGSFLSDDDDDDDDADDADADDADTDADADYDGSTNSLSSSASAVRRRKAAEWRATLAARAPAPVVPGDSDNEWSAVATTSAVGGALSPAAVRAGLMDEAAKEDLMAAPAYKKLTRVTKKLVKRLGLTKDYVEGVYRVWSKYRCGGVCTCVFVFAAVAPCGDNDVRCALVLQRQTRQQTGSSSVVIGSTVGLVVRKAVQSATHPVLRRLTGVSGAQCA